MLKINLKSPIMPTINEITDFIHLALDERYAPEQDIFRSKYCISGDDCAEFLEAYAMKYNVDMTDFLWYFHYEEEGFNIGSMFFKTPDARVEHIPITPIMLETFANKGKWDMTYPEHTLPKYRIDLMINSGCHFVLLLLAILILTKKYCN